MKVVKHYVKIILKKIMFHFVLPNPSLKEKLLPIVKRFPRLNEILKTIKYSQNNQNNLLPMKNEIPLYEESTIVYQELKSLLNSSNRFLEKGS